MNKATTWRDHVSTDEEYTVLAEYDDGSAVCLGSHSGGDSADGEWGSLTLIKIDWDGTTTVRPYFGLLDWSSTGEHK